MSDPILNAPSYRSLDGDVSLGGPVRRAGIGLMRPFAVVAAIAGVGVILYFLLSSGEKEQVVDNTPREEFRPVQTPRNEGFRTPAPPPLPTVQVPEAPPPPPPAPPHPVVPTAAPALPPAEVDCTRGKNSDNPRCIEITRQAKLLERVRSSAMVFDKTNEGQAAAQATTTGVSTAPFGLGAASGADAASATDNGGAVDGDRAFLKAMGGRVSRSRLRPRTAGPTHGYHKGQ